MSAELTVDPFECVRNWIQYKGYELSEEKHANLLAVFSLAEKAYKAERQRRERAEEVLRFYAIRHTKARSYFAEVENAESGLEAVENIIRGHFEFVAKRSKDFLAVTNDFPYHTLKPRSPEKEILSSWFAKVLTLYQKNIERGIRDGTIRLLSAEKTAHILRGVLYGLSRQLLQDYWQSPDYVEESIDLFVHGIARGEQPS